MSGKKESDLTSLSNEQSQPAASADKSSLNKAKRAAKKARRQANEEADKARRAAAKADKKRRETAFKATIVGNYIVDENGVPIRPYTRAERILDNKLLAYGIAVGSLLLFLALAFFLPQLFTGS
jgi:Fe2+ transport system protein B